MKELVRKELIHSLRLRNDEEFLQRIDDTGGWPLGYQYVSFFHDIGDNRYCIFTDTYLRTGWWTTVASADDYYWWKISDERKQKELGLARKQLIAQLR